VKKIAHFFGSRFFFPSAKTPRSSFAPKPNEKGWLRRLYQLRNVKVEIYKFAMINVHFLGFRGYFAVGFAGKGHLRAKPRTL